jgi:competence protein ComEC
MSYLTITVIDVGWGDSILIEAKDNARSSFGLIDSNDTTYELSSYLFLKRFFERRGIDTKGRPVFEFVLLTHGHADHASGLPLIIRKFGAKRFLYSRGSVHPILAQILRYQNRPNSRLRHSQAVDDATDLSKLSFGSVSLDILWPPANLVDGDQNNHSVVLSATLDEVTFVLTGDATADVWPRIVQHLPKTLRVFQVPHHGAHNGTFAGNNTTPWLDHIVKNKPAVEAVISSHIRPFNHPNPTVVKALANTNPPVQTFRTDLHYHVSLSTDGADTDVSYSH